MWSGAVLDVVTCNISKTGRSCDLIQIKSDQIKSGQMRYVKVPNLVPPPRVHRAAPLGTTLLSFIIFELRLGCSVPKEGLGGDAV